MKAKFILKHFMIFVLAMIGILLVSIILFIGLNYKLITNANKDVFPMQIFNDFNQQHRITEHSKAIMENDDIWMIVINQEGDVIDSYRQPEEVPHHYRITDIARFTRWYLADYPVFTYIYEQGLVVIGYPKDSYVKISSNIVQNIGIMVFKNIIWIVVIDLLLLFVFYTYSKRKILREIGPIQKAIKQLSRGEVITEKKCDNLSEIMDELVLASNILEEKNSSKNKWLRGVTHDIRTPLTVIMAYAEELSESIQEAEENRKLENIKNKAGLINKILESLNIMYQLEDKNQLKTEKIELTEQIKNIVIDYLNTYPVDIEVNLPEKPVMIKARSVLIERVIRNILDNSIIHNSNVKINIELNIAGRLRIWDNGFISEEKLNKLNEISDFYNTMEHGYGILLVKKIVEIYGGKIWFNRRKSGLEVRIDWQVDL